MSALKPSIQASLIISDAGLQNLMSAGISTGWLSAWLQFAGATDVSIGLLESGAWKNSKADIQIFFATEAELNTVAEPFIEEVPGTPITLDNPTRHALHFQHDHHQTLLLPIGEIAYQRNSWLAALNNGEPLLPLYIAASDALPIKLEPGMSASLDKPAQIPCLNNAGLMIEEQVINTLKEKGISIRTVESCTAGGIVSRLCRVPGSSEVVDRSWVTYSNQAKQDELDVDPELIEEFGAVSQDVVIAMANGGVDAGDSDQLHICIATSGIAGPGGGCAEKPVGTVWVAVAQDGQSTTSRCLQLQGARHEIQSRAVIQSLTLMLHKLEKSKV
ncbi:CinA family protein [Mariprofundus sp. EBB-1]|nr:CinA family protein [Mariprofundus sp. EBB-1]